VTVPAIRPGPRDEDLLRALARMHLQWFAAEDEGRTEEPTEHKIRKAREEGKVAKSQDVTGAIVLLFTVVALLILARYLFTNSLEMLTWFLRRSGETDLVGDGALFRAFYAYFLRLTVPIAMVGFAAAIMGNVVQVGFLFTTKPIVPDFNRIAPRFGRFFKRAFLSAEAAFNFAKSLGKVVLIGALGAVNVAIRINEIVATIHAPFFQSFRLIAQIAVSVLLQAAIVLIVLSIFDYLFQRRQHRESLKMTRQEVKEERRTYEGDPLIKSRMRQRMQELLRRNMLQNVRTADVVITNPTHYAVAMEYDRIKMDAPTVTAKGEDHMAQRIRQIAAEHSIPTIENRPLARALYAEVEIGDSIPEKFYEAVVIVLKQVYRMTGRSFGGRNG